jgi:hypothetical protein
VSKVSSTRSAAGHNVLQSYSIGYTGTTALRLGIGAGGSCAPPRRNRSKIGDACAEFRAPEMVEECCYNLAAMTSKHSYRQHQFLRLRPARVHLYAWFSLSLALVLVVLAYSQTPNADDLVWQRSISQYTSTRKIRLEQVRRHSAHDRFQPTWKSLEQYRTPNWYRDAKFGIFVHWGVYSVPAFGSEWYPRLMYISGSPEFQHHVQTYGQQPNFGYKNFVPLFHAEKFVAQA